MENIKFDIEKLNKKDRSYYEKMNESEKEKFEKLWEQRETLNLKLQQTRNASTERNARERKIQADKDRRERTHRLIERGAILETFIKDASDFSNKEIEDILGKAINQYIQNYIEEVRYKQQKEHKTYF